MKNNHVTVFEKHVHTYLLQSYFTCLLQHSAVVSSRAILINFYCVLIFCLLLYDFHDKIKINCSPITKEHLFTESIKKCLYGLKMYQKSFIYSMALLQTLLKEFTALPDPSCFGEWPPLYGGKMTSREGRTVPNIECYDVSPLLFNLQFCDIFKDLFKSFLFCVTLAERCGSGCRVCWWSEIRWEHEGSCHTSWTDGNDWILQTISHWFPLVVFY